MKFLFPYLCFLPVVAMAQPAQLSLSANMHITSSAIVKKDIYHLNATEDFDKSVIVIEGNNITIDFNDAILAGSNDKKFPNEYYGTGILVKNGKNITIKNARVKGFKIALFALNVDGLTIENCDFSFNYRQHLQSNREREDVSDWMSYHHNEKDEWMRYGAGIYLSNCNKAKIFNNLVSNGQCGLMMSNCNDGMIFNNNFSFNSAIGIGLYRSSRNAILRNKLDFNVRGYSHGIYWRGQDSAGILVFEQCSDNQFNYNSATHSGDGFFLWAGQTTMDTGEGGCNDNIILGNDFSYAPTNGIEVTFSRNFIQQNTIKECDHGIWGGYSYNTFISKNIFVKNRIGIAIEHGQDNSIYNNKFNGDKEAIKLWARKTQPPDWIYAQKRDTRSKNYHISNNNFRDNPLGINVTLSDSVYANKNSFEDCNRPYKIDSSVFVFDSVNGRPGGLNEIPDKYLNVKPLPPNYKKKYPDFNFPKGKKEIRITEWGPYNFQYPIVWLSKIDSSGRMYFDILGPKGTWKIKRIKGIGGIFVQSGTFPASISGIKISNSDETVIELEYIGASFVSQLGEIIPAKQPYSFSYYAFNSPLNWNVNWYKWDELHDPNKGYSSFQQVFNNTPLFSTNTPKLEYTWWGKIGENLPADSFATVATTTINLPKGKYKLGVTADDLVKLYVDGKPVIDFWDASKYVYDEDAHHSVILELEGKHDIRLEHVENSGFATILFSITPVKD
ncbi:MAG TPA: right-handed parallel beta-helix repeat-containing protein [Chitinophagaceae bacterium]|nr:right-handed parallel beta-helix repeat-containing protein [Chitinophagaceae bacterium]